MSAQPAPAPITQTRQLVWSVPSGITSRLCVCVSICCAHKALLLRLPAHRALPAPPSCSRCTAKCLSLPHPLHAARVQAHMIGVFMPLAATALQRVGQPHPLRAVLHAVLGQHLHRHHEV